MCQSLWCSCLHLPLGAVDWQGGWFEVCSAQLCSLRWHCSHVVMPAAELSGYLTHVPSRRFPPRRCVSVTCAVVRVLFVTSQIERANFNNLESHHTPVK